MVVYIKIIIKKIINYFLSFFYKEPLWPPLLSSEIKTNMFIKLCLVCKKPSNEFLCDKHVHEFKKNYINIVERENYLKK